MENVLVAGATGTTGKIVVDLLKESQYFEPIAMVRKEEQKNQFESRNIKTVLQTWKRMFRKLLIT